MTFLGELQDKGVDLFLFAQGLDTSTAAGRALFGFLWSWRDSPENLRAAVRDGFQPEYFYDSVGFRCVREGVSP